MSSQSIDGHLVRVILLRQAVRAWRGMHRAKYLHHKHWYLILTQNVLGEQENKARKVSLPQTLTLDWLQAHLPHVTGSAAYGHSKLGQDWKEKKGGKLGVGAQLSERKADRS